MALTKPNRKEEIKLQKKGCCLIAGVDEAGRGAWAGPIVAAAVVLSEDFDPVGINDSKKLSAQKREYLYRRIIDQAIAYNVALLSNKIIDKIGVGQANLKILKNAVTGLRIRVDYALVDGFDVKIPKIESTSIKKGDAKVLSIAAASIVAKVTRDRMMLKYDRRYPDYGFCRHMGYGTRYHHDCLNKFGICPIHRRSYRPIAELAG